ncbi:MAG: Fe-S cluster protein [Actinobacteria bacterium]|nr:Fe-S cluster protein [Actinomycetota bacterium]
MLVKSYKIIEILPCLVDPEKTRVIAMISEDVSGVLPYINAIDKNAIYTKNANTLTLPKSERLITIHPRKIAITKLKDEQEAKKILDETIKLINETFKKKSEIKPDYERRKRPNFLDIYKLLPKTNCRKCGELTCFAFAAKLVKEEIVITRCSSIFESGYKNNREKILKILQGSGFEIPVDLK